MNLQYLWKIWRLFKSAKIPNYDHLRWAIKGDMLRWEDNHHCWIEEGVCFDNKTLDKWINLKFNPGDSTTISSSADKGISILSANHPHPVTSKKCIGKRRFRMQPKGMPPSLR
jgi:hypothetical protein